MKPPFLNRRLVLETPVQAADGSGGLTTDWQALGDLWAFFKPSTGRERLDGGVPRSVLSVRIIVRAAPHGAPSRPQAGQRFKEGSRVFNIMAVGDADDGQRFLTCFAEEELAS